MLGILARDRVAPSWLNGFKELARSGRTARNDGTGHRDGWGIAYHLNGRAKYLDRQPLYAYSPESRYDLAVPKLVNLETRSLIAHVRKSSRGNRYVENTHPFIYENMIFAHNGTIQGHKELPVISLPLEGNTDSERFFKCLLESMAQNGGDVVDAIATVVRAVRRYTSMTFLLSNGEALYAFKGVKAKSLSPRVLDRLNYYTLKFAFGRDCFILCSEDGPFKPMDLEWRELENGELLVVDGSLRLLRQENLFA